MATIDGELEAVLRDIDSAVRKAERKAAQDRFHDELEILQARLERRLEKAEGAAAARFAAVRDAVGLAARLIAAGRDREALVYLLACLHAVVDEGEGEAGLVALGRAGGGELSPRKPPILEAFVARQLPLLERLTPRQVWERLRQAESLEYLGEPIRWTREHPTTGRPGRDGYLRHDASGRAVDFRTFRSWLEKFSERPFGH